MSRSQQKVEIYLESGKKKVVAAAVDWPGWARAGRDEAAALADLLAHAPRYAQIVAATGLDFAAPTSSAALTIAARLPGDSGTDYGIPAVLLPGDSHPLAAAERDRLMRLLDASWQAFEAAVAGAQGKPLRKGPRGGGRELEAIAAHVLGAAQGYLKTLGWPPEKAAALRGPQDVRAALRAAAAGELPTEGPRGGKRWPPRYFARRLGWHLTDHLWEIEDRLI